jgi:hypothetical protein
MTVTRRFVVIILVMIENVMNYNLIFRGNGKFYYLSKNKHNFLNNQGCVLCVLVSGIFFICILYTVKIGIRWLIFGAEVFRCVKGCV